MPDLTAANASIALSVGDGTVGGTLIGVTTLTQFSMEDIFTSTPAEANQVMMGVDGVLSGGYIFTEKKMEISLMANSPSAPFFDNWYQSMTISIQSFPAQGSITIPSLGYNYALVNGYLTRYPPISDARKVMQPRRFEITWQNIIATPAPAAPKPVISDSLKQLINTTVSPVITPVL